MRLLLLAVAAAVAWAQRINITRQGVSSCGAGRIYFEGAVGEVTCSGDLVWQTSPKALRIAGRIDMTAIAAPACATGQTFLFADAADNRFYKCENGVITSIGGGNAAGSSGAVQFNAGGVFGADASNFFWDNANKRLGIRTASPVYDLHVAGSAFLTGNLILNTYLGAKLSVDTAGTAAYLRTSGGSALFAEASQPAGVALVRMRHAPSQTSDVLAIEKPDGSSLFRFTPYGTFRMATSAGESCTASDYFLWADASGFRKCQAGVVSDLAGPLAGDVTGTVGSSSVERIRGKPVNPGDPQTDDVLRWAGSEWVPAPPKFGVQKGGILVGSRPRLNFIEGANVTLTVADNAASDRVDVTVAATGGGSGNAVRPYSKSFTNAASVSIPDSEHRFGSANLAAVCYDNGSPAKQIIPNDVSVDNATYEVVITFSQPVTGRCVLISGGTVANYVKTFTNTQQLSIPGVEHGFQDRGIIAFCYDGGTPSNQIGYDRLTVDPATRDVTIYFSQSVGGFCVLNGNAAANPPGGGGGSPPGGPDGALQFNVGGAFGGENALLWNQTAKRLVLTSDADPALHLRYGSVNQTAVVLVEDTGSTQKVRLQRDGEARFTHLSVRSSNVLSGQELFSAGASGTRWAAVAAPSCASGDYRVWADSTALKFRKCENGVISDLAPPPVIQDEGSSLPQRSVINFVGPGVACSDDAPNGRTNCSVSAGGAVAPMEVTRLSNTQLAIGSNCSTSAPCLLRFGSVVYTFTSAATLTLTGGSGTAYIHLSQSGTLTAGIPSSGMSATCSGCSVVSGITSFPAASLPIYQWTASSGVWAASGADARSILSAGRSFVAGTGITISESGSQVTISRSAQTVPRLNYYPAASCGMDSTGTNRASMLWNGPNATTVQARCRQASSGSSGYVAVTDSTVSPWASFYHPLSSSWNGQPVTLKLRWTVETGASGSNVLLNFETTCPADGDDWVSGGAASTTGAQSLATPSGSFTLATFSVSLPVASGCSPGSLMRIRILRDASDSYTGVIGLIGAELTTSEIQ